MAHGVDPLRPIRGHILGDVMVGNNYQLFMIVAVFHNESVPGCELTGGLEPPAKFSTPPPVRLDLQPQVVD